jgi:ABC-type branched-subunit amino acid transport system substrate-binding protein
MTGARAVSRIEGVRPADFSPPRAGLWWRRAAALAMAVLLAIGAGWGVHEYLGECSGGVERVGAECIGVTGGDFPFAAAFEGRDEEQFDAAEKKIEDENGWVRDQVGNHGKKYVSVAYVLPISPEGTSSPESIRQQVEGAFLAQRKHNQSGKEPLVRLLLGNVGPQAEQWPLVVADLRERVRSDHLVAVTGLGPSLERTKSAIRELSGAGIAMVAATATADDLTAAGSALVRVAFTNYDQAAVAARYMAEHPADRRGRVWMIEDTYQENAYSVTLAKAFRENFPERELEVDTYDSHLGAVENRFASIVIRICSADSNTIYFPGRGSDLLALLPALADRPCQDQHITVVSGDSASWLQSPQGDEGVLSEALRKNVSVWYTVLAHPTVWKDRPGEEGCQNAFPGASVFLGEESPFRQLFPGEPLDEASAIMAYDAVATTTQAISQVFGQEAGDVTPDDVLQILRGLKDVPGASGWISFDKNGNPINKAIPILEVAPGGDAKLVAVAWSSGSPSCGPS